MKDLVHLQLWNMYLREIKVLSTQDKVDAAGELLLFALKDAESFSELDERLEWCVYGIADDLFAERNYQQADALYRKLIVTKARLSGYTEPGVLAGFEKMAVKFIGSEMAKNYTVLSRCRALRDFISETTEVFSTFYDSRLKKLIGSLLSHFALHPESGVKKKLAPGQCVEGAST